MIKVGTRVQITKVEGFRQDYDCEGQRGIVIGLDGRDALVRVIPRGYRQKPFEVSIPKQALIEIQSV